GDPEALKKVLPTMPTGAFLLLLFDYAAGSLAGGLVAAWVARRRPALHALIVGGVLTVLGYLNLLLLPGHPAGSRAANGVVYLLPACAGFRLIRVVTRRRGRLGPQRRLDPTTLLRRQRAARVKAAALRHLARARHFPRQDDP